MRSAAAGGRLDNRPRAGSVDAYNPKVVRASAGACFAVRIVEGVPAVEMLEALGDAGVRRVGAVASGGTAARGRSTCARPTAFVLGHEAHGLDADLPLDELGHDPDARRASRSTSRWPAPCCCFEAARQRRVAVVTSAQEIDRERRGAASTTGRRRSKRPRRSTSSTSRARAARARRRR